MDNANKAQFIRTWWSKDLAKYLDIGESTLRKWSIELEKAGYTFLRDEHNRRSYIERDALALRKMKELLANGMSYDNASSAITTQYLRVDSLNELAISANGIKDPDEPLDPRYGALKDEVERLRLDMARLIEINRELFQRLDERDEGIRHIVGKLDERDNAIHQLTEIITAQKTIAAGVESERERRERERDERVTEVLRELREMKAAANKSVWSKLFGK